jgi:hypothetical protein
MGMIELSLVEPGMELASDAVAPNGFVLLPADAVVTAKHLQIFESWGLNELDVKGVTRQDILKREVDKIDPKKLADVNREIEELFRDTDRNDPATQEIFRHALIRAAASAAKAH